MTITIDSKTLKDVFAKAVKAIDRKVILDCHRAAKVDTKNNTASVTTCNRDARLTLPMPLISSDGDGSFCVNATDFADAVSILPEGVVTITANDKYVEVDYNGGHFSLPSIVIDEYPPEPVLDGDANRFSLPSTIERLCLNECMSVTEDNSVRPMMSCIYHGFTGDGLSVVSSNGRALVKNDIPSVTSPAPCSFLLPLKAANTLGALLKSAKDDNVLSVSFDTKNIIFAQGTDFTFTTCMPSYGYPDSNKVVNEILNGCTCIARCDGDALRDAVNCAGIFASSSTNLITFTLDPAGELTVEGEDRDYSKACKRVVNADFNGNGIFRIGLSSKQFNALVPSGAGMVDIKFVNPSKAMLITIVDQGDAVHTTYLLMPMWTE